MTLRHSLEERIGDNDAAAIHFESATGILRQAGPETRGVSTVLMQHYAHVLQNLHRKDQARAILAEAKGFRQR